MKKISPLMLRNGQRFIACGVLYTMLSGCVVMPKKDDDKVQQARLASNFVAAAQPYLKEGKPNYDRDNLLEALAAGKAFHDAGQWQLSIEAFNAAEAKMPWTEDTVDTPEEVAKVVGTTLLNGLAADYSGKIHEAAFVDYYQAINYLMLGDQGNGDNPSLVAMNRYRVRQGNVVSQLNSYVNSQNRGVAASKTSDKQGLGSSAIDKNADALNRGVGSVANDVRVVEMRSASGDVLEAYYRATAGLSGGARDAKDVLRLGMPSAASDEGRDLMRAMRGAQQLNNQILVLFEDGVGPSQKEFRVDLPLVGLSKDVLYTGVALPEFVTGRPGLGRLRLGDQKVATRVLTDVNRIAGLEFKSQYQGVVVKSVISTVLKTAAQAAVNREIDKKDDGLGGLFAKLAVAATQAALTRADTRAWDTLPNTIQAALVPTPQDGVLRVYDENGKLLTQASVPATGSTLVVLKTVGTAPPAMYVSKPLKSSSL